MLSSISEFEVASLVECSQVSANPIEAGVQGLRRALRAFRRGAGELSRLDNNSRTIQAREVLQSVAGIEIHHELARSDHSPAQLWRGRNQSQLPRPHSSCLPKAVGPWKK